MFGTATSFELWLALLTGLSCLVIILYAFEAKKASKIIDKWVEEIKFKEWVEKNKKKKES